MTRIETMRMHYSAEPPRRKPQAGDVRIIGGRTMIRQQVRHGGAYVVSNGRPVWEWVEKGSEQDRTANH